MRGLSKFAATSRQPTSFIGSAVYSTFGGSSGSGRGRGSGSSSPPPLPSPTTTTTTDDPFTPPLGHGRGRLTSNPTFTTNPSDIGSAAVAGRGRGRPISPPTPSDAATPPDPIPKTPVFFKRDEKTSIGAGRGKPRVPDQDKKQTLEDNRHLRRKPPVAPPSEVNVKRDAMGIDDAVKKAVEVLNRGGRGGGRGGRGGGRMEGRGGRGRGRGPRVVDEDVDMGVYLGNNADGERFEKGMGEERMKEINAAFDEMSYRALPSLMDEAYLDALHTNNMIEYEPEYLVNFANPDIDEKPPMSLEDALDKARPFLMAYEGIKSHEEWEEAVKDVMERLPVLKELMDMYCGPNRVTAKQQQQELQRVANTIPENVPSSVKRFTDRAVLSLQSNPGWGWDKKCQFMDKLAWEIQQHYK